MLFLFKYIKSDKIEEVSIYRYLGIMDLDFNVTCYTSELEQKKFNCT